MARRELSQRARGRREFPRSVSIGILALAALAARMHSSAASAASQDEAATFTCLALPSSQTAQPRSLRIVRSLRYATCCLAEARACGAFVLL